MSYRSLSQPDGSTPVAQWRYIRHREIRQDRGAASDYEAMECEICGAEVMEQPVKIVDSREDPDKSTNKPPPRRYAAEVIPYVCPKCRHEQFRRI
jgi:hypothetical protein